ncbi:phosphate acetyltransferase [Flavobacteriaceae bacterium Ap0902]|nr:phosphate acetyltransferase [Flavobacteriaceae bacterium Ap0902]
MNKGIYIATLEKQSGKSMISLGLMQYLLGRTARVAFFRPIIDSNKTKDNHIMTILNHFELDQPYDTAYALTRQEIIENRNTGKLSDSLEFIIKKYKELEEENDFVLVEGTDFSGEGSVFEFDWNVNVAKNLGLPTLLVSTGVGKSADEFFNSLEMAYQIFKKEEVQILGLVANKVKLENIDLIKIKLREKVTPDVDIYTIPLVESLSQPTIKEIAKELDAEVLYGEAFLSNLSGNFAVGAMQLRNFLMHLKESSLVITPGDRADIILGSLQAHLSNNYPSISGIILTGGLKPEDSVLKLIDGLSSVIPVLSVKNGTFETTNSIGNIQTNISADYSDKIITSIQVFQENINPEVWMERITNFHNEVVTPSMFQYQLVQRTKEERKRIVLPESNDDRILKAASRLSLMNIVDLILLGDEDEVNQKIKDLGLNYNWDNVTIVNPATCDKKEDYIKTFYELRKHKNINMEMARDAMADVSYFGTMMIYKGDADGMVSGAAHTTQHTIRPALQFIKTKPDSKIVSSLFFMCLPDRVSVMADCAINPNPNAEELAEIAISAADSSKSFGVEPRIAMLSYSSGTSGKGEDVDKVRKATEIVRANRSDLKVEGPIQYDAAVDMGVGKSKLPESEVAGRASILIFPDLNTGNNTYKAVQRETGALAIGPMLLGLNKPVNDLSRGCTVEDIFNTVLLTAIQAQEK